MNLLNRIKRSLARRRVTQKLSVWTRDHRTGDRFHYDVRVCPARSRRGLRLQFLVRFDRTGPQGNTERVYRRMDRQQVSRLLHESA